ncbi:hypothetical protein ASF84_09965 [Pseudomonas sp. Leaf127]|uniref:metallothionein n=1 Tax=Pseudomonas sp. Leaf127 TaxID=1736267 RepID=UPI000702720F|nr:metallothionein [Pseudomonas sp. Leaf127]KQQ55652.1 hypothetical protein ASF84_09965 [Pseudomonas sp. Leaf127]
MSATTTELCACPGCTCSVNAHAPVERDGKTWCSEACADHHPNGAPCPSDNCHCEQALEKRTVSDRQLDEAVEETFPASDPISP